MDPEFLLDYAVVVASLSLIFLAVARIVSRRRARNFSSRLTKRNALTYALHLVNDDEGMLAVQLGVPIGELLDYLHGKQDVPFAVFRKAIHLVLEKTQAGDATEREV